MAQGKLERSAAAATDSWGSGIATPQAETYGRDTDRMAPDGAPRVGRQARIPRGLELIQLYHARDTEARGREWRRFCQELRRLGEVRLSDAVIERGIRRFILRTASRIYAQTGPSRFGELAGRIEDVDAILGAAFGAPVSGVTLDEAE